MTLTLPQPKLTQYGLSWVVVSGTLRVVNAFASAVDAAEFAKNLSDIGTPQVNIGHTVFGWYDLVNLAPHSASQIRFDLNNWAQQFHNDEWHKARYNRAVVSGEID
jgi:hypothetical protein